MVLCAQALSSYETVLGETLDLGGREITFNFDFWLIKIDNFDTRSWQKKEITDRDTHRLSPCYDFVTAKLMLGFLPNLHDVKVHQRWVIAFEAHGELPGEIKRNDLTQITQQCAL